MRNFQRKTSRKRGLRKYFIGAITILALTLIVIALYAAVRNWYCPTEESISLTWLGAFIAIANALLLFATLQTQNNSIALQNTARFETTFFNLLSSHRQLTNEICIYRPTVDIHNISNVVDREYKGRQFFPFALNEIHRIYESITKTSLSYYDKKKAKERMVEFSNRSCCCENENNENVEIEKIYKAEEEALLNSFYKIKEEDLKNALDAMGHSFVIFDRKMKVYYEQYERSLVSLLTFIRDSGQNTDKYINIVKSQIGLDEYHFIQYLLSPNKKLLKLIVDTELYIAQDDRIEGHRLMRCK